MKLKACAFKIEPGRDEGLEDGTFTAYASVFSNVDSYGDIVQPGAFEKTLAAWAEKGSPIPLLYGHRMDDPDFNIGHVISAKEDDRGLLVTAQLDLENPKAVQVYRMLKGRRIDQMSFAYDVIDAEERKEDGALLLNELDLFEVSIVPIGANSETEILAVKAAAEALVVKAGRVLSAKNENTIRETADQLEAGALALRNLIPSDGDEKAQEQASGKEPSPGESAQTPLGKATPNPSVSLAAIELSLLALKELA